MAGAEALLETISRSSGSEETLLLGVADLAEAFMAAIERIGGHEGQTADHSFGEQPSTQVTPPPLLSIEQRCLLGLLVVAVLPLRLEILEQVFEEDDAWDNHRQFLQDAGYVQEEKGYLKVVDAARDTIEASQEEVVSLHQAWIEILELHREHPDVTIVLSIHYFSIDKWEEAVDALCNVAVGLTPGHTNEFYLRFLEQLADSSQLRRLSPPLRSRFLNAYGLCLSRADRHDEAIEQFQRLRRYAKRHDDAWAHGQSLINEGVTRFESGRPDLAERRYRQAIAHAQQHEDRLLEGRAMHNLGMTLIEKGDSEAESLLKRSCEIKHEVDDQLGIIGSYLGLGFLHSHRGNHSDARKAYKRAEQQARKFDLPYELSLSLVNQAGSLVDLGEAVRSHKLYEEARQIAETEGFNYPLRLAVQGEAIAHIEADSYREAEPLFQQLYEIQRERGDEQAAVVALHDVALCQMRTDRGPESRQTLGRALARARRIGDEEWVYRCRLASAFSFNEGRFSEEVGATLRRYALKEQKKGYNEVAARLLLTRAKALQQIEAPFDAILAAFDEAAEIIPETDEDLELQLDLLVERYALLRDEGYFSEAIVVLDEMINFAKIHHRDKDLMRSLNEKGTCLQHLGQLEEAEPFHRQALVLAERLEDNRGLLTSQINLAESLRKTGRSNDALPLFKRAKALARAVGDDEAARPAAHDHALALELLDRLDEAEQILKRLRNSARKAKAWNDYTRAVHALGDIAWRKGDLKGAIRRYRHACDVVMEHGEQRAALMAAVAWAYAVLGRSSPDYSCQ